MMDGIGKLCCASIAHVRAHHPAPAPALQRLPGIRPFRRVKG